MAVTTVKQTIGTDSAIASAEELRAFTERKQQLTWLAEFLTDDEVLASACVADAARPCLENPQYKEDGICPECLEQWSQEATIRFALELKRSRIFELSSVYESGESGVEEPLSLERIELVVKETDVLRRGLDSLCRFVLILRGIGHQPVRDVAKLLGVSRDAVEAAYCRVLEFLEIIESEKILAAYGFASA